MKRLLDLALAIPAFLFLLPLTLSLALLVRVTSPGPALYWSTRVGKSGRLFRMPKLRTMRLGTPVVATHLLQDPRSRLTSVGGLLRAASLDELPQLWCVIKGEMSLVGPRPALPDQTDLLALRAESGADALLPGITGWAQINGRDTLSVTDKAAMDVEYLRRRGMGLDLRILWLTFSRVLRREGVAH